MELCSIVHSLRIEVHCEAEQVASVLLSTVLQLFVRSVDSHRLDVAVERNMQASCSVPHCESVC